MAQHPTNRTANNDPEPHLGDHNTIIAPVHNRIEAAILAALQGQGLRMGASAFEAVDLATLSNDVPAPSSVLPSAGDSLDASRRNHRHPADLHACAHPISIGVSGGYCGVGYIQVGAVSRSVAGQGVAVPVVFDQELPLDRMAVWVQGAGTAGSLLRLGLWADHPTYRNHRPGAVLRDCGTTPVAGATDVANNMVEFAFPTPFTPEKGKRYWPVCIWQTALAAQPEVYYLWADFSFPSADIRGSAAKVVENVTGAIPDATALEYQGHNGNVRFWFRAE